LQTIIFSVSIVDYDVAALDETHFAEALAKCVLAVGNGSPRSGAQISHDRHPLLLRARRNRPHRRAAKDNDEFASSHHSMTSSASASRVGDTSMPSVRAVCRLRTSSNLVGCITGRSAGFSPLRMRPA